MMMKVVLTGADGFIGKNLRLRLQELGGFEVLPFTHDMPSQALTALAAQADAVCHLAGVNRPKDAAEFLSGNANLTESLCQALQAAQRPVPVLFTSSTQAPLENDYGRSKLMAEAALRAYSQRTGAAVQLYRLPNVFGKWSRPNYNSAVATFCHNVARGLPIQINNAAAPLTLVYVDDVVEAFVNALRRVQSGESLALEPSVQPQYTTSVGEVADLIHTFRDSRTTLTTEHVGTGLVRALYSTYLSFLPTDAFAYPVPKHADTRGEFVEMLKTPDSGQFSYFTAHPGITRGGHYHHTKTEKFLVIKGQARFRFRHMVTNERHELFTAGGEPQVVETVPGWTHDITNVGTDEMVVMLWANEVFDRQRPDTIASEVWK
jgi:UDP-2-acetamido-2,6-beta-L-arabino-hexul-4-ose reductase